MKHQETRNSQIGIIELSFVVAGKIFGPNGALFDKIGNFLAKIVLLKMVQDKG